jgi:hypothetical protein
MWVGASDTKAETATVDEVTIREVEIRVDPENAVVVHFSMRHWRLSRRA